jgi:putative sigma-54 modulation protein
MRLSLTGRHVEVTPVLRQLTTRRLARVQRILNDSVVSAAVVLAVEKRVHNVEITIHARGDNMITGKGSGLGWPQAFAPAIAAIMQQVSKIKEKWVDRKRRAAGTKALVNGERLARTPKQRAAAADIVAPQVPAAAPPPPTTTTTIAAVVRRTRYAVKPMSLEDAALRIESVSEPFVVFRHAETERINILYQRPDGRLGLIDPEM